MKTVTIYRVKSSEKWTGSGWVQEEKIVAISAGGAQAAIDKVRKASLSGSFKDGEKTFRCIGWRLNSVEKIIEAELL